MKTTAKQTAAISPIICATIYNLFIAIDARDGALVFEPTDASAYAATTLTRAQVIALYQFFRRSDVELVLLHIMRDHLLAGSDAARQVMALIDTHLGPLPALAEQVAR